MEQERKRQRQEAGEEKREKRDTRTQENEKVEDYGSRDAVFVPALADLRKLPRGVGEPTHGALEQQQHPVSPVRLLRVCL